VEPVEKRMRVLVCGGRKYRDKERVDDTLSRLHTERGISVIITADKGAAGLAADWAKREGIECAVYLPRWRNFGACAEPINNQRMLAEGRPDLVVAFWGGRCTTDMVRRAHAAGLEVIQGSIRPPPTDPVSLRLRAIANLFHEIAKLEAAEAPLDAVVRKRVELQLLLLEPVPRLH
jgi:SLOG family YspA-like protein